CTPHATPHGRNAARADRARAVTGWPIGAWHLSAIAARRRARARESDAEGGCNMTATPAGAARIRANVLRDVVFGAWHLKGHAASVGTACDPVRDAGEPRRAPGGGLALIGRPVQGVHRRHAQVAQRLRLPVAPPRVPDERQLDE